MSFIEGPLSHLPLIGGVFAPPSLPSFNPNIGRAETAYQNKYAKLQPILPTLTPAVRNSLINFDLKRVSRGQTPLSLEDTAKAIRAATTHQAATLAPEHDVTNVFGNAVRNIGDIVSSIPRLPAALFNEGKDIITKAPEEAGKALGAGNPFQVINALSHVPGIRDIPGAYVVGNLANGGAGIKELASNPVMTALDVLPLAQKVAEGSAVSKAYEAQRAAVMDAGKFAPQVRPIRAVLTKTLDETGLAVPNRVGRIGEVLAQSPIGKPILDAWSQEARAAARVEGRANIEYKNAINPNGLKNTDPLISATREAQTLADKYNLGGVENEARRAELSQLVKTGADRTAFDTLPTNEQSYITEYRDRLLPKITAAQEQAGLVTRFDDELYDTATANRLHKSRSQFSTAQGRIDSYVLPRLQQTFDNFGDQRIGELITALEEQRYGDANRIANGLYRGKTRLDRPQAIELPKSMAKKNVGPADATLAAVGEVRKQLRDVLNKESKYKSLTERLAPARFQDLIGQRASELYANRLGNKEGAHFATPETAGQVAEAILRRDTVDLPGFNPQELTDTVQEVARTWKQMRDTEGLDPAFVHRVTPERAKAARFAGVQEYTPTITSAKARVTDVSPAVQDIGVALSHQGMELLAKNGSEAFQTDMIRKFGVTGEDLKRIYSPAARAREAISPGKPFTSHLQDLIKEQYTPYHPESMNWSIPSKSVLATDDVYLPRGVADNLKRMHAPKTYKLSSVIDPATNLFRTAVLPLAPRWHVYNILGGGLMTAIQSGTGAFKYIGQARDVLRALKEGDIDTVAKLLPGNSNREFAMTLGGATREMQELKFNTSVAAGKTMGRLFGEAGENSPVAARFREMAKNAGEKFTAITDRSFELNQWFDDMYRTMAYFNEAEKAGVGTKVGTAAKAAEDAALEGARKIIHQWDEYTPIERQLLRQISPFYGFTQFVMRAAFKYPFDHPIRANLLGSITRNELEDLGTGLPHTFLNSLFFGSEDSSGHRHAIQLGGLNPFRDVANNLTLAGFVSSLNPVLSTALEQLGVRNGATDLYPNLRYDSTTGQLAAQHENPLVNFLQNVIPQSQILTGMLGASAEFKDLANTDPAAALRGLASQGGIPILFRDYDVPAEYFKQEIKRSDEQNTAMKDAFKSGDYSYATRFPGLSGLMQQVRQLQASPQYAAYQPTLNRGTINPATGLPNSNRTNTAYNNQLTQLGG